MQVLRNIYILFFNFLNVGNSKQESRHSGVVNPALVHWAWGGGHARGWPSITCALVTPLPRRPRVSCVTVSGRASFPCPDVVQMQLGFLPPASPGSPAETRHVWAPSERHTSQLMVPFQSFQVSGCSPFSFPFFLSLDLISSLWNVVEFCPLTTSLTKGPAMLPKSFY